MLRYPYIWNIFSIMMKTLSLSIVERVRGGPVLTIGEDNHVFLGY